RKFRFDLFHVDQSIFDPDGFKEPLQISFMALGHDLHPAVRQVHHISLEAKDTGYGCYFRPVSSHLDLSSDISGELEHSFNCYPFSYYVFLVSRMDAGTFPSSAAPSAPWPGKKPAACLPSARADRSGS